MIIQKVNPTIMSEFKKYYEKHVWDHSAFFLYFTSGMLMFVLKSLKYIPSFINVQLIGNNLEPEEIEFIDQHIRTHLFHIQQSNISDQSVLDMLLHICTYNFGYMDVDTFVLNPQIFQEIMMIENDTAIKCYRTYQIFERYHVCETNFMYFNITVCKEIPLTPYSYSYRGNYLPIPETVLQELSEMLPVERCPFGDYFDTLILFQLLCIARGKKILSIQQNQLKEKDDIDFFHLGNSCFISNLFTKLSFKTHHISLHNIKSIFFTRELYNTYMGILPSTYKVFPDLFRQALANSDFLDVLSRIEKNYTIRSIDRDLLQTVLSP